MVPYSLKIIWQNLKFNYCNKSYDIFRNFREIVYPIFAFLILLKSLIALKITEFKCLFLLNIETKSALNLLVKFA